MSINNITRNDTIDAWRIQTNQSANALNTLESGNYNKSSGILTVSNTATVIITTDGTALQVSNNSLFQGDVTVGKNIYVGVAGSNKGNTQIAGSLHVLGANTALTVDNSALINKTLTVADTVIIQGSNTALQVSNSASIGTNLFVDDNIYANNIQANSSLSVLGNLSCSYAITAASFNGELVVSNLNGILPIAKGGTNSDTATGARSNLGLSNVENKSSATIRSELESANVTNALGYTPSTSAYATASFTHANSAYIHANSAYIHANSAFNQANVSIPAFAQANAAFDRANTKISKSGDTISGILYPSVNNTYDLGSPGSVFATVYATTFNGTLSVSNLSGILPIAKGGTNSSTESGARSNLGLGNVENKSSATIRSELVSANVTTALGFTPATSTYAEAAFAKANTIGTLGTQSSSSVSITGGTITLSTLSNASSLTIYNSAGTALKTIYGTTN